MSQQTTLTDFFSVRKKLPDQHAAKRRKIVQQECKKGSENTSAVVTSAVDSHVISPKTPSASKEKDTENSRQSKRSSKEFCVTPSTSVDAEPRFTQGCGKPASSVKKKLYPAKEERPKRNVEFTKLSSISPKKKNVQSKPLVEESRESHKFKVPTPVKELISAHRPDPRSVAIKQLFCEDSADGATGSARVRTPVAEVERASRIAKKFTAEEIKEKIGKPQNIFELKEKLKNLRAGTQQLEKLKQKSQPVPRTPTKAGLEIELPASPSKFQTRDLEKASPRKVPAYQRYSYLTQPVEKTLPLPYNYRMLAEVFRCTDTIVSMMFNRQEEILYSKLAKAVQDMMRKNFGERFLKQLKCVFPQAYFFAWEKIMGKYGKRKEEYELSITPNINYKNAILTEYGGTAGEKQSGAKLTAELMVERRNIFHNSLLQMVKDQHRDFLATLDPPIQVNEERLTRWHKDFNTEACRDIDLADLPPKPTHAEKMTTAKEVLEKANQIFNINPRLGESLVEAAEKIKEAEKVEQEVPAPPSPVPVPKALKGINPKLLEKIRAKEAQKALLEMTRNHADIFKIKQLRRLPNLARLTRSLFVSENKSSLTLEFVVKKLVQSYPGSVEPQDITEDLRVLHSETAGWLSIQLVRTAEYVLVNNTKNINAVCEDLENKLKKSEST